MIDLSKIDKQRLAKVFDYSVLPKDTNEAAIRKGCALSREYQFAAFYSSSAYWTPIIKEELAGYPDIEIGTGIAFPWGSVPASVKAFETEDAVRRGCTAVDVVMNIGALKDKRYDVVREELAYRGKQSTRAWDQYRRWIGLSEERKVARVDLTALVYQSSIQIEANHRF